MTVLTWRPGIDPDPHRWGYFQVALIMSYLQDDNVDAAITALDDVRASNPRANELVALIEPGRLQNQLTIAVSRRWAKIPRDPGSVISQARLARVIPQTYELAGHLLDEAEEAWSWSPAYWQERGGWWLGRQQIDTSARQHAINAYKHAVMMPWCRFHLLY